ncbi:hypothetical protein BDV96DRAFT_10342 [Lophiotrema nucula]|uniref:DUF1749-domain-containing protein n=1 Tax=Lophiotrema nucula TaxID=690887 RepID=A0A6A5ZTU6_9PLEO|nr:hypothetical protein BDV96DRAFT_10342 [Lophiotrema nucula]
MAHPGTLHRYTKGLVAFEHSTPHLDKSPKNTIIWIGGLSDGLLTVKYPAKIAASLPPTWSLVEILLSSSYEGWGTSSLAQDADELEKCVKYLRGLEGKNDGKVALMGHSTGCQDIMEYLIGPNNAKSSEEKDGREKIDAAILQGGLSDREAFGDYCEQNNTTAQLEKYVKLAGDMVKEGRGQNLMPQSPDNPVLELFGSPVTAYRFYSLLAEGGDDDYFSSDLSDSKISQTFGKIPKDVPFLLLFGEADPYVPSHVDKEALLKRWADAVKSNGGASEAAVIPKATHNLNGDAEEVIQGLVDRVKTFLRETVDGEHGGEAARL